MARTPKTKTDGANQAGGSTEEKKQAIPESKQEATENRDRTKGGFVMAKLKARHCTGGRCHDKGETIRLTRGQYERLKKFDRVE